MGTPHRGSDKTPLGHIAASVAKIMLRQPSRKLLKVLEKDSDVLEHQRRSFDSIKEQLYVVCLHEAVPLKHVGMVCPIALQLRTMANMIRLCPNGLRLWTDSKSSRRLYHVRIIVGWHDLPTRMMKGIQS